MTMSIDENTIIVVIPMIAHESSEGLEAGADGEWEFTISETTDRLEGHGLKVLSVKSGAGGGGWPEFRIKGNREVMYSVLGKLGWDKEEVDECIVSIG